MVQKAVVLPENVRCDVVIGSSSTGFFPPAAGTPKPGGIRFLGTGFAMVADGDLQAGLHATSERVLCDLEFMQFVKPTSLEVTFHHRTKGAHATERWKPSMNRFFLDGHPLASSPSTHANAPFMSATTHDGRTTRDGHFKNNAFDTPEHTDFEFHTLPDGERLYLWRVSRLDEFMLFLVFIHPTGERQPIAMAKWSHAIDYTLRWEGDRPVVQRGQSTPRLVQAVTKDAAAMAPHAALITSPPGWLHPVANSKALSIDTTPLQPFKHVALEANFFTP